MSNVRYGSRNEYSAPSKHLFLKALNGIREGLGNLDEMLEKYDNSRARMAAATGNSKLVVTRSMTGFLVTSYEPIDAWLNNKRMAVSPLEGSFLYINDWEHFIIDENVLVMGIENPLNFRHVHVQRKMFETAFP